ncbi:MAG: hypothetical protein SGI92_08945, partial [Bryobacteraceae bacterium]|nr:hypothetical protein [Bryobacteraceae bacterium]
MTSWGNVGRSYGLRINDSDWGRVAEHPSTSGNRNRGARRAAPLDLSVRDPSTRWAGPLICAESGALQADV